ncbi:MAG TPA: phosphoribosylanthranilate isomerase [Spirochaetes bacterium]|nr:phosphoribosylanthranilate isomerase [Spirochaetota bacterium]
MIYTRIKICGLTNLRDADLAVSLGADALGFIFCKSPRQVSIPQVHEILGRIPPFVNKVAVVRDFTEEQIREILSELPIDTIQFHGSESEDFCLQFKGYNLIKVISIRSEESLEELNNYPEINHFLLDTYTKGGGGSGRTFNWKLAKKAQKLGHIILAGGLNYENVSQAIVAGEPYGVDVSSGVESEPGIKDPDRLERFFQQVRQGEL